MGAAAGLTNIKLSWVKLLSATGGTIPAMGHALHTIAIHPSEPAAVSGGCGHCQHAQPEGPTCQALLGQDCPPPQLRGPQAELQRLLAALGPALGFEDGVGQGVVRALMVQPGEVDLQLAIGRHCGGAALADAAFQTLRGLLPDTDIYVTTAG